MRLRPCARPGCGALTMERYCASCAHVDRAQKRALDHRRGSANTRGYTARWRRRSKAFIARHPLCHYCTYVGRTTATECVDHAVPPSRGGDFWDESNWRPSCGYHNRSKSDRTEQEFLALLRPHP